MRRFSKLSWALARLSLAALFTCASADSDAEILGPSPDWLAADGGVHSHFGNAVSTAGDVDGDGYSDVLVACPGLNSDLGAAFVYCGGPSGLSATACWIAHGTIPGRQFAINASTAGDVNGDGYDDVLVGAWGYEDGESAEGGAFVYHGSPTGPSATHDWLAEGNIPDMFFGYSVAAAGDVNGDGYDDVLVGSHWLDDGIARLHMGSAIGLSTDPDWTYVQTSSGGSFAFDLSSAGDVNSDGYDDVIIGDPAYGGGGRAYLFYGSASGLSTAADWTADGESGSSFGSSVSLAGDVDGDGYCDIAIGAQNYDSPDSGIAWVYYGGPSGPTYRTRISGGFLQDGARYGSDVRTAGDVNADGFADVLVGAPLWDDTLTDQGRAFLFLGSPDGIDSFPAWQAEGENALCWFGNSVSGAGDVNSDGYSDVIIGGPNCEQGQLHEGTAYVYLGNDAGLHETPFVSRTLNQDDAYMGHSVSHAGDLNGDGLGDVVSGAYLYDGTNVDEGTVQVFHGTETGGGIVAAAAQRYGSQASSFFGVTTSRAGDVNGDGYDDLLISEPLYDQTFTDEGALYLYHGSPTGISTSPDWTQYGGSETAWFGYGNSGAGDVNGDGYADVIVGAFAYTNALTNQGAAYVYLGSETGLSTTPSWSIEGSQSGELLGRSVAGVGDLNGDGYSDIAVASPGFSWVFDDEGAISVFFGSESGPSPTADWTITSGQAGVNMGSVGGAGDVNGDGYDDLLTGTQFYEGSFVTEGRARLFYGSTTGPSTTPDLVMVGGQGGAWLGTVVTTAGDLNRDGCADFMVTASSYDDEYFNEGGAWIFYGCPSGAWSTTKITGGQESSGFGISASTAGDLNGDGFADLIIGSETYDLTNTNAGAMHVYLGNADTREGGLDIRPQQKTTAGAPISWRGVSDAPDRFLLAASGRSPMGRDLVRAEWQIAEVGTDLAMMPIEASGWFDTGTPVSGSGSVASVEETILGLADETLYHWRMRTRTSSLYAPITKWVSIAPTVGSMAHLRTGSASTEVGDDSAGGAGIPPRTGIGRVVPNPLRDQSSVLFQIANAGPVRLTIHDVNGRQVATLIDQPLQPGSHSVQWDGANGQGGALPSGLYFARLSTPEGESARKVWITR